MNGKPLTRLGSNRVRALMGAVLILLGILFLVGRFVIFIFDFNLGHYACPFFMIIPGVLMLIGASVTLLLFNLIARRNSSSR